MNKYFFCVFSLVIVSILSVSCEKDDSQRPIDEPQVPTEQYVSKIVITSTTEKPQTLEMSLIYDNQNHLVKVTNFKGSNLEYVYNNNGSVDIKSSDINDEESYYTYNCISDNGLIKTMTYQSHGFTPVFSDTYRFTYDTKNRLMKYSIDSESSADILNWNEEGNCFKIEQPDTAPLIYKSLGVPNTANIDFSSLVGGFLNYHDLQRLSFAKLLGTPNKDIMVDAEQTYKTKIDDEGRLIEIEVATKSGDKVTTYSISYSEVKKAS